MEDIIQINEVLNYFRTNYKDQLVQIHTVKGGKEAAFTMMYALRRSSRYDNNRKYRFQDRSLDREYQEWVDKNETIEMFYGGAVVD